MKWKSSTKATKEREGGRCGNLIEQTMTVQAIKREALNHAEATRRRRLGPGYWCGLATLGPVHWCGLATLGPGHGSGGSPPAEGCGDTPLLSPQDSFLRLRAVDYPSGSDFGYQYDAVGNRTKMFEYTSSTITTTYTYDDADELTQWTTSTVTMAFTYASDGCLVTKSDGTDTWTYEWDYERRLEAFKKNSATLVEYTFNPTGTRRQASDSTLGLTNHFYSGDHVLADYSSNWTLTKSYVGGPRGGALIGMVDRTTKPNTSYYLTKDRLGSTRELVNGSETINTRYAYDEWGTPTETQLSGSVSTDYRFRGWYYASTSDHYAGTGLDYDAGLGRMYERITTQLPTLVYALINPCTSLLEEFQPGDWGEECRERNDCGPCCDEKYAECRTHKTSDILVAVRRYELKLRLGLTKPLIVGQGIPGTSAPPDCEEERKKCRKYCWDAWWAGNHENDPDFTTFYHSWNWCERYYSNPYTQGVHKDNWQWSSKTACGYKYMCCLYGLALYDDGIENSCETRDWCISGPNNLYWCADPPPFYNEADPENSLDGFCGQSLGK